MILQNKHSKKIKKGPVMKNKKPEEIIFRKPTAIIQCNRNEVTLLQSHMLSALSYVIQTKDKLSARDVFEKELNFDQDIGILKYVDYAVSIAELQKLCNYKSRNTTNFIDNLKSLCGQNLEINILNKDKTIDAGLKVPLFKISGISSELVSQSKSYNQYLLFSVNEIITDLFGSRSIGTNLPLITKLKNKFAIALYENILDYRGTSSNGFGARKIEELVKLIGGENYYRRSYSAWKQKVLDKAIDEIKNILDIVITIEETEKIKRVPIKLKLHVSYPNSTTFFSDAIIAKLKSEIYKIIILSKGNQKIDFDDIMLKMPDENYSNFSKYIANKNNMEAAELIKKFIAYDSLEIKDLFFSRLETQRIEKIELEILNNSVLRTLLNYESDLSKWEFLNKNENQSFSVIEKNSKNISVSTFKRFMYLYNLDENRNNILLRCNDELFKILTFKLDDLKIVNLHSYTSDELSNKFIEFLKVGICTFKNTEDFILNAENIDENLDLLFANLSKGSNYFNMKDTNANVADKINTQKLREVIEDNEFSISNLKTTLAGI